MKNVEICIKRLERIDKRLRELEGISGYNAPEVQEKARAFFGMMDDPYLLELQQVYEKTQEIKKITKNT